MSPLSPPSTPCLAGPAVKEPQQSFPDFFPDCFSLAEKPPAEFCLSPDGNTESVSVDLLQKKGRSGGWAGEGTCTLPRFLPFVLGVREEGLLSSCCLQR